MHSRTCPRITYFKALKHVRNIRTFLIVLFKSYAPLLRCLKRQTKALIKMLSLKREE